MTKMNYLCYALGVSLLSTSWTTHAFAPSSFRSSATTLVATTTTVKTALGMFTGIVEEMGTVVKMEDRNDMTLWDGSIGMGTELTVRGDVVMDGAYLGCSICVSGVCLTATVLDDAQGTFTVGLAPETLDKTYFRSLQTGQAVNLERASEIGGRNSGHFVQGHVDGTGTIVDKRIDGDSLRITVQVDEEFADNIVRYVVPKGFIAIDGTSLTVVDVNVEQRTFGFMLVEYTQKKIIIPQKKIGEKVNLEVDVLGKYSETAMASLLPRLEALEARVESLERRLASAEAGSRTPPAASSTRTAAPPPQDTAAATTAAAAPAVRAPMISEGTPSFSRNISDDGVLGGDPNSSMMRPEGSAGDGTDDQDEEGSPRRVSVSPDPKLDGNGGITGDKFVRIS
eukprot:CAMPEP_0172364080 /NCGR_PEP_ID=MMETSP1060-20121228/7290_1 /TAXON_ID=37318 /ORGANISM="Pseudo-nitzschia pungens, Strain cf. cingulata" /LENGTH=395 /DNA_ID=CAMNT_0013087001 /DNA_START=218 /DNA_END=1405 /DNA_ORIENTATION=-